MNVIALIGLAISVVKLIIQIIAMIRKSNGDDAKGLFGRLRHAVRRAKETGSTADLDALHAELKRNCGKG